MHHFQRSEKENHMFRYSTEIWGLLLDIRQLEMDVTHPSATGAGSALHSNRSGAPDRLATPGRRREEETPCQSDETLVMSTCAGVFVAVMRVSKGNLHIL